MLVKRYKNSSVWKVNILDPRRCWEWNRAINALFVSLDLSESSWSWGWQSDLLPGLLFLSTCYKKQTLMWTRPVLNYSVVVDAINGNYQSWCVQLPLLCFYINDANSFTSDVWVALHYAMYINWRCKYSVTMTMWLNQTNVMVTIQYEL